MPGAVPGQVEIAPVKILTPQALRLSQLAQGVFDRHLHYPFQLPDQIPPRRQLDQRCRGIQQGTMAGKPRAPTAPQALRIEPGNGAEGVKPAPMGVAGLVGQGGQLAEYGGIGLGAQGGFHLRHRDGAEALKEVQQRLQGESDGSHNARILP